MQNTLPKFHFRRLTKIFSIYKFQKINLFLHVKKILTSISLKKSGLGESLLHWYFFKYFQKAEGSAKNELSSGEKTEVTIIEIGEVTHF